MSRSTRCLRCTLIAAATVTACAQSAVRRAETTVDSSLAVSKAHEPEGATDDARAALETPQAEAVAPGSVAAGAAVSAPSDARPARARPRRVHPRPPADALQFPSPETDAERYPDFGEHGFVAVSDDPRSTFSIDVDTASYANVRRFLSSGRRPPPEAVRTEELVNYFNYDYPEPRGRTPFSVVTEVGPAPWQPGHRLLHIGIQGKKVDLARTPPRNLVFLVDVSGSMQSPDKLPLLKRSLAMLVEHMRPQDRVAIVVYAGASGLVLPPTNDPARVIAALDRLEAGGSTNGAAGLTLAYDVARRARVPGGINRVILATDGDFNVGPSSPAELRRLVERQRDDGIFLSVLGFGTGNLRDDTMQALAQHGNGNHAYIDSLAEAHKVLVAEAGGTLVTIAKDVKIQVEFHPARVAAYRLIGYETRRLAHRDFDDDRKDAGDIGAGHTVTALYEIVPAGAAVPSGVGPSRYQRPGGPPPASAGDVLATVRLRYKAPHGLRSRLLEVPVRDDERSINRTSNDFRFSAAVAEFAMLLRRSRHAGGAHWNQVRALARGALGADRAGRRRQFLELVEAAAVLP